MHQRWLSANFLGCSIQLHQCQHRHWGSGGLDQEQVFGGPRRWSCSTPQPQQNGECLCHHRMGCRLRRSSHLTKCHFLCWHDGLPCTAGTNQSGVPEWGTRKKFPSTHTTRTGGPKRRGFCKGDSGPHSCTADLPHYGPTGYARLGRGSDYHGLFEIWCLLRGLDDQDDPVLLFRLKDEDLLEAPDDSAFLQSLRFSCARVNGVYPPLALAEAFTTEEDSAPRVRRLHLIVVDLHRRRRLADRVRRLFSDIQVDRCANECWNTLPIPWEAKSRGLPAPICLWIRNGWQWPSVLHPLAHTDCGTILLVHWCLERWLGSAGQMLFHCSGGNWTLLRCLLPSPTKALASSCMPSFGHSFLPCCRGHPSWTFACE